jgi:uncharacterized delta-60 repeat protein
MSQKVNIGGVWKDAIPYAKIGSTWKLPKSIHNKVDGVWKSSFLQSGVNDSSFTKYDTYSGFNLNVFQTSIQSDGKIITNGVFTSWNGTTVGRVVRLNSDGTIDTTFTTNNGSGANELISYSSIQSDGKIVVGGQFTSWNGTTVGRIVRINSDGTRDTTFTTNNGSGASGNVNSISIQSDSKIILGGQFDSWNGTTVGRVVRLNSDGTRDTTFSTNIGSGPGASKGAGTINSISIQSDGKIMVGGQFTSWNGTTLGGVVRLNSDGTIDTTFTTNNGSGAPGTDDNISSISIQSDGKIILCGSLTSWNGTTVGRVVRLNSDGTRDTTFTTNTGSGANERAISSSIRSDGKIVISGIFTTWNGTSVNRIVLLNSDGTIDTTFTTNVGTGANNGISLFLTIDGVAIQPDGKIVISGDFTTWNGTFVGRVVRLNSDGTRDSTFISNIGSTANSSGNSFPLSIEVQLDGKIIVAGSFQFWNGDAVGNIVRLNSDGTVDTAFANNIGSAASTFINAVQIQSDGKIIIGGDFTTWNGVSRRVVRLNSDGTLDTTFATNIGTGPNNTTRSISFQSDGKILIGGDFTSWNGTTVGRIVRLNSDGTIDTTFTTNTGTAANSFIFFLKSQQDDKIIVGGNFTSWNGNSINRIIRLNSNGTIDNVFSTNLGSAANSSVNSISIQPDGKIIIIGPFTTWNGVSVNRIVRLNSDGTRDTNFTTNIGTGANSSPSQSIIQSDGKIVIVGDFVFWNGTTVGRIVRLNSDGTIDTTFTTNPGSGANNVIRRISLQPDGKMIIAGDFQTFNNIIRTRIARLGGDFAG